MPTPEYIVDLRRHIGHDPLWLMGASVVILRDGLKGREVLLFQRADTGEWDVIAGIVEPGEHPAQTVVREAWEEGCIEIAVERLLWVDVMDEITYPNGDRCRFLDHGFQGRIIGGSPSVGDGEASDLGWFPVDRLPHPRRKRLEAQIRVCLAQPEDVVFDLVAW